MLLAQGDEFLEELVPLLAGLEAAVEEVAFEFDAFLVAFAAVGADDAAALVAGLAAGVDGGAVEGAEFLAGEQEGQGAGGEESQRVHGAEAAGAEAVEAAAFVVVVGVARGEARAGEARRGLFVLHQDARGGRGDAPVLPGVEDGVEAVVVLGVAGEAEEGVARLVDGVGVLAELVEVVVVGGVHAAGEEVGVVVEAVAFGHEEEVAARVARAEDGEGFVPEGFVVDEVGHVEAEAVDAVERAAFVRAEDGEPMIVDLDHGGAEGGIGVVELGGVGPVAVEEGGAVLGLHIVLGVRGNPDVVARGVVGGDVEEDLELEGVRAADEVEDFGLGAVFGLDGGEVARGVGRTDAFARVVSDRIRREEIHHIEAEAAEARQMLRQVGDGRFGERFFRGGFDGVARFAHGQRAEVDLVDDRGRKPRGV